MSLGWLTESALFPRKSKSIEGLSDDSAEPLRQLVAANKQASRIQIAASETANGGAVTMKRPTKLKNAHSSETETQRQASRETPDCQTPDSCTEDPSFPESPTGIRQQFQRKRPLATDLQREILRENAGKARKLLASESSSMQAPVATRDRLRARLDKLKEAKQKPKSVDANQT